MKSILILCVILLFYLQETQKEKSKPAAPAESSPAATPADDQQDEDSEPPPPSERPKPRGRRMAFSAEPYTEEDAASYVKKVRVSEQSKPFILEMYR